MKSITIARDVKAAAKNWYAEYYDPSYSDPENYDSVYVYFTRSEGVIDVCYPDYLQGSSDYIGAIEVYHASVESIGNLAKEVAEELYH